MEDKGRKMEDEGLTADGGLRTEDGWDNRRRRSKDEIWKRKGGRRRRTEDGNKNGENKKEN